jgi:hypothetical protein
MADSDASKKRHSPGQEQEGADNRTPTDAPPPPPHDQGQGAGAGGRRRTAKHKGTRPAAAPAPSDTTPVAAPDRSHQDPETIEAVLDLAGARLAQMIISTPAGPTPEQLARHFGASAARRHPSCSADPTTVQLPMPRPEDVCVLLSADNQTQARFDAARRLDLSDRPFLRFLVDQLPRLRRAAAAEAANNGGNSVGAGSAARVLARAASTMLYCGFARDHAFAGDVATVVGGGRDLAGEVGPPFADAELVRQADAWAKTQLEARAAHLASPETPDNDLARNPWLDWAWRVRKELAPVLAPAYHSLADVARANSDSLNALRALIVSQGDGEE